MSSLDPAKLVALSLAAALAAVCACDEPTADDPTADDPADDAAVEPRNGPGSSGPLYNTNVLLATDVPAIDTTGFSLNNVTLDSVHYLGKGGLTSVPVHTLYVDHGTLRTKPLALPRLTGGDFIGSVWTFYVGNEVVQATLTNVQSSDSAGLYMPMLPSALRMLDPERLVYTFANDSGQGVVHTCEPDPDGGTRMVLYNDLNYSELDHEMVERPNTIYFGCLSGAVGKAALWGYAPDSPSMPSVSLAAFNTAIRTVRADYCGDGVAHTGVANPVAVIDNWDINLPWMNDYTTEALWGEGGGAMCVSRVRETGEILAAPFDCGDTTIPLCPTEVVMANDWNAGVGDIWTSIP